MLLILLTWPTFSKGILLKGMSPNIFYSEELVYQNQLSLLGESPLECFRASLSSDSNGHQIEKSNAMLLSNIFGTDCIIHFMAMLE